MERVRENRILNKGHSVQAIQAGLQGGWERDVLINSGESGKLPHAVRGRVEGFITEFKG